MQQLLAAAPIAGQAAEIREGRADCRLRTQTRSSRNLESWQAMKF
jgi:hypothetical protein